jgi:hypothetical protein
MFPEVDKAKAHNHYGPSVLGRRVLCPGSGHAEKGLPDVPSEAAAEGAALHKIVAQMIPDIRKNRHDPNSPITFRPMDPLKSVSGILLAAEKEFSISLPDNTGELVTRCMRKLHGIQQELREKYYAPDTLFRSEREVLLVAEGRPYWGTADVVMTPAPQPEDDISRVAVIDWKFGRSEILPTMALWQIKAYAALLAWSGKLSGHISTIHGYVYHARSDQLYTMTIFVSDAIRQVAEALTNYSTTLAPGEEQCKHCRAFKGCSAASQRTLKQLLDLDALAAKEHFSPLYLEALGRALPEIERWCEAGRDQLLQHLGSGGELESVELVPHSGQRRFENTAGAISAIMNVVKDLRLDEISTVSVPKATAVLAKGLPACKKGKGGKSRLVRAEEILEPFVTRSEGSFVLKFHKGG